MNGIVAVVGTGTEVGKTWVGAATLRHLREQGVAVAARKPAQSFDPALPEPTDADVLANATGEPATQVCPSHRWLTTPMAPPMAADALGLASFTLADLLAELDPPGAGTLTLVETAGGLRSPIATDGDCLDYVVALQPDAVALVADAGLGTINVVRLCHDALGAALPTTPVLVVLNRFDPAVDLHVRNRRWLAQHDGIAARTSPADLAAGLVELLGPVAD